MSEPKQPQKTSESHPETTPEISKTVTHELFQRMEMLAMQSGRSQLDLSSLSPEERLAVLDIAKQKDQNIFTFQMERLKVDSELEKKRIESSTINQRTIKIGLFIILVLLGAVTFCTLFFKPEFFINWLSFIAGLLGGTGLTTLTKDLLKKTEVRPHATTGATDKQG
ncbi:MAG: hypothetical protein R3D58_13740 [Saprospiraceae bacterium]